MEKKHAEKRVPIDLTVHKGDVRKETFYLSDFLSKHSCFEFAKRIESSCLSLEEVAQITGVALKRILEVLKSDGLFDIKEYEAFTAHQF